MKLLFSTRAWDDYRWWADEDRKLRSKIDGLIADAMRSPFKGIGKPEPLKGELSGWWSRRINDEHRMVYRLTGSGEGQQLEILQLRFHYR
ncbi:MAG: Txe/YoeB family addiction module toxin [Novosphingobium sp.]